MPTYTTTYNLGKPVVGADEDAWGDTLNASLDSLDGILDGTTPVTGIDINSGTIDNVVIGGATPAAGTFTTLTANTSITGTLATAAQPNITSVGSLTSLDVAGTLTSDGLTVDGSITLDNATAQNIRFTNTAVNPTISSVRALNIDIDSDGNQGTTAINFTHDSGAGTIASFNETGDISFYEDTGTTPKFFWDASAERLGIGTSSPVRTAEIVGGSAGSETILLQLRSNSTDDNTASTLRFGNSTAAATATGSSEISGIRTSTGSALDFRTQSGASLSTAMRIDSSGNVGIGTSSPSYALSVAKTTTGVHAIDVVNSTATTGTSRLILRNPNSDTNGNGFHIINNANDGAVNLLNYKNTPLAFWTNSTERMRIDSSGNLLVGTTAYTGNTTNSGGGIRSDGLVFGSVNGGSAAVLNRISTDGDIATFRKDGTTVGSISTINSVIGIGGPSTGVKFATGAVIPTTGGTTNSDAAQDLGASSVRFKDLYLSGGVYLGGTGAANKLDDYEEGTFTPTIGGNSSNPTVTYSTQYGYYTKIGRMVYISLRVRASAYSGGSGQIQIDGLPFTPNSGSQHNMGGTFSSGVSWGTGNTQLMPWALDGQAKVRLRAFQNNATNYDLLVSDYSVNDYLDVNGWYFI
jgi:hypothetical protein